MTNSYNTNPILDYIKTNWFKLSLIILVLFACVRKNLIFDVRLKGNDQPTSPAGSLSSGKDQETLTVNTGSEDPLSESSFKIPLLGSGHSKDQSAELSAISDDVKIQYLKRFAKVAVGEQTKFHIPASIILAAALTQSFAGKRDIAISGNNHFGLSCTQDWQGAQGIHQGDCYRVYDNAWSSFRDNSQFIVAKIGGGISALQGKDYKAWAKSLEKSGYLDQSGIADELIQAIQYYQLEQLDKP